MNITFHDICNLLESVETLSTCRPRLPKEREQDSVRQIVANWFSNHRQALDNTATNTGSVLSVLFPHRRKDRVYGYQAPSLSKKIGSLLDFNHGQKAFLDAWADGQHVDLGLCVGKAMRPWDGTFKIKRQFPVQDIDNLLVRLAAKCRFSDPAIRRQRNNDTHTDTLLKEIFIRLESWEAKWLVRLILRDYCTIELDEPFTLKQLHFLLPELLMFQNDFDAVSHLLRSELSAYPPQPDPALERSMRIEAGKLLKATVGIKVGRPVFHKAWSFKHCLQLVGNRAWAAEVKYDGEYCEIHIDLNSSEDIQIFSKNGKDATADRQALHDTIRRSLRIGHADCRIKLKCILLGELVLWCDKQRKILPFSKIRKHIQRSGSFIGTLQDSIPYEWEHLMIVYFDVLQLDDDPVLRKCLQDRRRILKDMVKITPGRAMRSEWTLIDFKAKDGVDDLKQSFARTIAKHQEGLVLKPLHTPYFPLANNQGQRQPGYFIKLKRDYLADLGGERDLGDFAIVGASFDPQIAARSDIKPLHWTHFHIGCVVNKLAVERTKAKPIFKMIGVICMDKCIPKPEFRYLNVHGRLREVKLVDNVTPEAFDIERSNGYGPRMTAAFKNPFVAEILGGAYEKQQNETFEMLRHPRIKKIHHDRTWEDAVSFEDLQRMAQEKWDIPDATNLDGHAKDIARLTKRYRQELGESQTIISDYDTTQETTQQTTPRSTQTTPRARTPRTTAVATLTPITPPPAKKRRSMRSPLKDAVSNRSFGAWEFEERDRVVRVWVREGWRVEVGGDEGG
ncbi:hypothetical protein EJ04DRAFT_437215 [Polyplosphaeria fusca]|uniref:ATP-dependent DNA ligase family profile domain-containing protein n=1 Tax=Polyplosphaeria fusca TaxID=682080 RepID=A0A9P4UZJ6_9PLEO|nr:hypothetical protein EJ04DRAFT_437215 [Polyplosphaeria fusca]